MGAVNMLLSSCSGRGRGRQGATPVSSGIAHTVAPARDVGSSARTAAAAAAAAAVMRLPLMMCPLFWGLCPCMSVPVAG